jgi:hypothetical protein
MNWSKAYKYQQPCQEKPVCNFSAHDTPSLLTHFDIRVLIKNLCAIKQMASPKTIEVDGQAKSPKSTARNF